MSGISPGCENEKVRKTAMGAADYLKPERLGAHSERDTVDGTCMYFLHDFIREKQTQGYTVYALETAQGARSLFTETLSFPLCVILGNEEYGLDESILACVDHVLEIPMFGCKNSLNVAVSGSLFFYEARRQWENRSIQG